MPMCKLLLTFVSDVDMAKARHCNNEAHIVKIKAKAMLSTICFLPHSSFDASYGDM